MEKQWRHKTWVTFKITHHQLVFGAMYPEFFQPHRQVVDTDASVAVHVQDSEQHFESVLLLRPSTCVMWIGRLTVIRVPAGVYGLAGDWGRRGSWRGVFGMPASAAAAGVDPRVGLVWSALTENITEQGGHQRALLVHLWTGWHPRGLTVWERKHLLWLYPEPCLPRHMSLHFSRFVTESGSLTKPTLHQSWNVRWTWTILRIKFGKFAQVVGVFNVKRAAVMKGGSFASLKCLHSIESSGLYGVSVSHVIQKKDGNAFKNPQRQDIYSDIWVR